MKANSKTARNPGSENSETKKEIYMKVSSKIINGTAKENLLLEKDSTEVDSFVESSTEKEFSSIQMEMFTKEFLNRIKKKEEECLNLLRAISNTENTQDSFQTTSSTDKEL